MKKLLAVAVVVGALASPAAFAQTLYGVVDVGYQHAKHASGDVNKHFITSGDDTRSRLGVRGSEDLAPGTYAMYRIEMTITADTGASDPSGLSSALTFVGLGSKTWGEFTFGRQYTHTFHTFAVGAAAGYGTFGSTFSWTGFIPSRASNSVKYSSPVINGFSAGAIWSPGGGGANNDTEPTAAGADANYWDGAVRWTPGPFGVAASYGVNTLETAAAVETETKRTQFAANWDKGAFGVYGHYWLMDTDVTALGPTAELTGWSVSGVARFGGRHAFYVVYGQREDDRVVSSESTIWGIAYQHELSKRTRVYAGYAYVENDPASARAPNFYATSVAAGFDPSGFQLGMLHTF